MKKVFLLLIVIGLISPIMVVAQWTPATTSSNTPISRSGLVGIGFDAPTAPSAQLHLFSNSKDGEIDLTGKLITFPMFRLERNESGGELPAANYIWDVNVASNGKLDFTSYNSLGESTNAMRVGLSGLTVRGNLFKLGDDNSVRTSVGIAYNMQNGTDGSYISFAGTRTIGGGVFQGAGGQGKTAIIGDSNGSLSFLTAPSSDPFMTLNNHTRLSIGPDGEVVVQESLESKDLIVSNNVSFSGLQNSTTDLTVLVADANGAVKTRTIPADIWDGDDAGAAQTLSVSGSTLSISNGNSVTLPTGADNLGNHSATTNLNMNGNNINSVGAITMGGGVTLTGGFDFDISSGRNVTIFPGSGSADGVGINRIPNPGFGDEFDLDVEGEIRASNVVESSDRRLKKDIRTVDNALDKVLAMNGVRYKLKKNDKQDIGFIAQELKTVLPDLVYGREEGSYSVRYTGIIPVLVEAMKEQQTILEDQDAYIQSLEERLTKLETLVTASRRKGQTSQSGNAATAGIARPIAIAPNPVGTYLHVSNLENVEELIISNLSGQEIKTIKTVNTENERINLNNIEAGIYIISAFDQQNQLINSIKFIKK